MSKQPKKIFIWIALIILLMIPRFTDLGVFVSLDETLYWKWSNGFFQALAQHDWGNTFVGEGRPAATVMMVQAGGLGGRYLFHRLTGESPSEALARLYIDHDIIVMSELATRRASMVLFNSLAMVLLFWLVRRQFGDKVALTTTIVMGLDPFILSDSRTMRADALMGMLMTSSAITLLIYLNENQGIRQYRYLLISGLATGIAFANKLSALAITPFILVMVSLYGFLIQNRKSKIENRFIYFWQTLLIWCGTVGLVFWAIWPAMWVMPIQAILELTSFVKNTGFEGRANYFMGKVSFNDPLPFFYFVTVPLRLSPLVMIGLISFSWQFGWQSYLSIRALKSKIQNPSRATLTVITLLIYILSIGLIMTIGLLKADHYVMPIFPALDIIGALGLLYLFEQILSKIRQLKPFTLPQTPYAYFLATLLILQILTIYPHHPYYYSYFNPLILGSKWAPYATQLVWGLDLGVAAQYLNSLENSEKLKVASPTVRNLIPELKGTAIRFVWGEPWIQADYFLMPIEDIQFNELNKLSPPYYDYMMRQPLVHVATFGGLDLAWIYRGPAAEYSANSKLDGLGFLLGYNSPQKTVAVGDKASLKLFWQNDGASADHALVVQLRSPDGYVWAETTAQPLPDYAKESLTPKAIVESQADLTIPTGTPPDTYFLTIGFRAKETNELLGTFQLPKNGQQLTITRQNSQNLAGLNIDHSLQHAITPDLTLLGYTLSNPQLIRREPNANWLTLFWQANENIKADYAIALQLLNQQGQEATYWLGQPVLSRYPTSQWQAGETVRDPWRLELPATLPTGDYTLQVALFKAKAQVGQLMLGQVAVIERRQQFTVPRLSNSLEARLGQAIKLHGYDFATEPLTEGGRLRVTLYWQTEAMLPHSYTVFVHILDANGKVVAQHDGVPVNGTIPTQEWAVGEIVTDAHLVTFPHLPRGTYNIVVGMYDLATSERLPTDRPDAAILLRTLTIN